MAAMKNKLKTFGIMGVLALTSCGGSEYIKNREDYSVFKSAAEMEAEEHHLQRRNEMIQRADSMIREHNNMITKDCPTIEDTLKMHGRRGEIECVTVK
jgi:hypothetical protein